MTLINVSLTVTLLLMTAVSAAQSSPSLSYQQTIDAALSNDLWQQGNDAKRRAMLASSEVVSALPNPTISMGLANIAGDSLAFNQEAMTQLTVGVSQQFVRGDSLALSKRQLQQLSQQYPMFGLERRANLSATVAQIWLRIYQAQHTQQLIRESRPLFEQLTELAQRSYQVGQGRTMQSDLISAEVELISLDDRLEKFDIQAQHYRQQLGRWLPYAIATTPISNNKPEIVTLTLPVNNSEMAWAAVLNNHPSVKALDAKQQSLNTGIDLARQSQKIQWRVNSSYGWRSDAPNGQSRSDLLSLGVSLDLPIFNKTRSRQQVSAAKASAQVASTDKLLLIRQMRSNALAEQASLTVLKRRLALYIDKLIPQTRQQAEAALTAYGNDNGEFSRVVLARLSELNRRIDAFNILIEMDIATIKLNYYLTQVTTAGDANE